MASSAFEVQGLLIYSTGTQVLFWQNRWIAGVYVSSRRVDGRLGTK